MPAVRDKMSKPSFVLLVWLFAVVLRITSLQLPSRPPNLLTSRSYGGTLELGTCAGRCVATCTSWLGTRLRNKCA